MVFTASDTGKLRRKRELSYALMHEGPEGAVLHPLYLRDSLVDQDHPRSPVAPFRIATTDLAPVANRQWTVLSLSVGDSRRIRTSDTVVRSHVLYPG